MTESVLAYVQVNGQGVRRFYRFSPVGNPNWKAAQKSISQGDLLVISE
jgi:hypothetical protein